MSVTKLVDQSALSYTVGKVKALLDDKVDVVAGKQLSEEDFTSTLKNKLDGLSNYTLPNASSNTLGGVMVGAGLSVDANGVLSRDAINWSDIQSKPDLAGVYRFKGSVSNLAALGSISTPDEGDTYNLEDTGMNVAWVADESETGGHWDNLGSTIDLSGYTQNSDWDVVSNADIDTIFAS